MATDLFGLGTVLYELATGEVAFDSDDTCFKQEVERASPIGDRAARFPAAVADVIDALLEPEPQNRPASAADVLLALDAALPANHDPMWPPFITPKLTN